MKKQNLFSFLLILALIFACSEQETLPLFNDEITLENAKAIEVPFKFPCNVQLDEVIEYIPGTSLHQVLVGSGKATHMGLTSYRLEETVDMTGFPWTAIAHVDLVAANGDVLTIEYSSSIDPTTFPDLSIQGSGLIIGGTGRFDGCTGTIVMTAKYNTESNSGEALFIGTLVKNK